MNHSLLPSPQSVAPHNLLAYIVTIESNQHASQVAARSRDYFWYRPALTELLEGKTGEVIGTPRLQDDVIHVAAAYAKYRLKIAVRGGGTGNYGQCVPMEGGIILNITQLSRVLNIEAGAVPCDAGSLIADLETALRANRRARNFDVPEHARHRHHWRLYCRRLRRCGQHAQRHT